MQVREALHGHQELRAAPVQAPLLRRRLPALRPGAFWQSPMGAASHTVWGLLSFGHLNVCMCASHFFRAKSATVHGLFACIHPQAAVCVCSRVGGSYGVAITCAPAPATRGPASRAPCPPPSPARAGRPATVPPAAQRRLPSRPNALRCGPPVQQTLFA